MRRIQEIVGRSDDMLIIRGVNVFPSQFEDLILQIGLFCAALLTGGREGGQSRCPDAGR